jgi:hypothetical protein
MDKWMVSAGDNRRLGRLDRRTVRTTGVMVAIVLLLLLTAFAVLKIDLEGHYQKDAAKKDSISSTSTSQQEVRAPETEKLPKPSASLKKSDSPKPDELAKATTGLTEAAVEMTKATAELVKATSLLKEPAKDKSPPHWGESLGTIGDFFGGIMNPILGIFTVAGLAYTIILQQAGMSASKTQSFETTFFNLLDLHNKIVQDLRFDPSMIPLGSESDFETQRFQEGFNRVRLGRHYLQNETDTKNLIVGRQVFLAVLKRITQGVKDKKEEVSVSHRPQRDQDEVTVYHRLQRDHNDVLGHYFRNLYQLLKLVDRFAPELDDPSYYSSIIRAQLSTSELKLLFYNCLNRMVDDGQFKTLVIRYRLLEHLPIKLIRYKKEEVGKDGSNLKWVHKISCTYLPNKMDYYEEYFEKSGAFCFPGAFGQNPQVNAYLERVRKSSNGLVTD